MIGNSVEILKHENYDVVGPELESFLTELSDHTQIYFSISAKVYHPRFLDSPCDRKPDASSRFTSFQNAVQEYERSGEVDVLQQMCILLQGLLESDGLLDLTSLTKIVTYLHVFYRDLAQTDEDLCNFYQKLADGYAMLHHDLAIINPNPESESMFSHPNSMKVKKKKEALE